MQNERGSGFTAGSFTPTPIARTSIKVYQSHMVGFGLGSPDLFVVTDGQEKKMCFLHFSQYCGTIILLNIESPSVLGHLWPPFNNCGAEATRFLGPQDRHVDKGLFGNMINF